MSETCMSLKRARDISGRLGEIYHVVHAVKPGPMPSLADVSLREALEATRLVAADRGEVLPNGARRFTCYLPLEKVSLYFACGVAREPLSGTRS